jgi:hypothetical protein
MSTVDLVNTVVGRTLKLGNVIQATWVVGDPVRSVPLDMDYGMFTGILLTGLYLSLA